MEKPTSLSHEKKRMTSQSWSPCSDHERSHCPTLTTDRAAIGRWVMGEFRCKHVWHLVLEWSNAQLVILYLLYPTLPNVPHWCTCKIAVWFPHWYMYEQTRSPQWELAYNCGIVFDLTCMWLRFGDTINADLWNSIIWLIYNVIICCKKSYRFYITMWQYVQCTVGTCTCIGTHV